MTDDKAPVELLGMKVIDELIRDEVGYYKEIFQEGGWCYPAFYLALNHVSFNQIKGAQHKYVMSM